MYFTTSLICVCLLRLGLAGYTLEDDYSTDNFFSMFNFETVRRIEETIILRLTDLQVGERLKRWIC